MVQQDGSTAVDEMNTGLVS